MKRIRMLTFWACFQITRPVNVLIGMCSIFVGALITGTIYPLDHVLWACLSGGVIAGAANAINDYFDVGIDRINKPDRPIPAGKISQQRVFYFALILFGLGLIFGLIINFSAFLIAFFSSLLLYWYSARLKRTVLWGNLSVSLVTGLAFIYGGVAVDRFQEALIPAGFSFLFHLGREIIKDTQDVTGDAAEQAITLPIRYGRNVALSVASLVYLVLIVVTILPYLFQIYGIWYLGVVVIGVDLVVVVLLARMWVNPSPKNLGRISNLLKADMFMGLIAIFLGKN